MPPEQQDEMKALLLYHLRQLPFVLRADLIAVAPERRFSYGEFDALIRLHTPAGVFDFVTEVKRSYLDQSITNALIAVAKRVKQEGNKRFLLFARYVPRPTGERLIDAEINFVDLAGNVHLNVEPHYHWTVLGRLERSRNRKTSRPTPATLQVMFTVAAHPEAAQWSVRQLAVAAGVSKSKAATTLNQLLSEGVFRKHEDKYWPTDPAALNERLLAGYRQVLRPHLLVGQFRSPDNTVQEFLERLRSISKQGRVRYSLTGGPAAFALQRLYTGPHAPIFIEPVERDLLRTLRLLPDESGPVILLRVFGDLVFWRKDRDVSLADPWLIYAELMSDPLPRAHEAAEYLRKEFLQP
jgi:hypothetical protein